MTLEQALSKLQPPIKPDWLDGRPSKGRQTKIMIAVVTTENKDYFDEWFVVLHPDTSRPVYFQGHGSSYTFDYSMRIIDKLPEEVVDDVDWITCPWCVVDANHMLIWQWYEEVTGDVIERER